MNEVNERNAKALSEQLKGLEARCFGQAKTIQSMQATLTMLTERLGVLEQKLNVQTAQLTGRGPTVR